jgi:hypothetical protein
MPRLRTRLRDGFYKKIGVKDSSIPFFSGMMGRKTGPQLHMSVSRLHGRPFTLKG